MSRELLLKVARCDIAKRCLTDGASTRGCAKIVRWQGKNGFTPHRIPEPWNGRLTTAPLLFVASNPSISKKEWYPDASWTDDRLVEFFEGRFGEEDGSPISFGGRRALNVDGTRDTANRFLSSIRRRALELGLERPGIDYAVTEVVHCKTPHERFGVVESRSDCVDRYLRGILEAAGARVVVFLGRHAAWAAEKLLGVTPGDVMQPFSCGGRERTAVLLPHPNARGRKKSLAENLGAARVAELRACLAAA